MEPNGSKPFDMVWADLKKIEQGHSLPWSGRSSPISQPT